MIWKRGWPAYVVAVVLAAGYVLLAPHTADLAAQTARAELFQRSGLVSYWAGWYGGIATASYSLTTPPLLGLFGPVWLGGIAIVGTSIVAVPLLRDADRPRAGAVAFTVAATFDAFSGRTTFAVGVVVALAAVWAAERRKIALAAILAGLATFTSPVAGFLLLVVAAALLLADPARRRVALGLAGGVGVALVVLAVLSRGTGGGGYQPFTRSSLLMAVATAAVVALAPVGHRVRAGAVVTVGMLIVIYFVHSPIGANATRIAVLVAAPVLVAAARLSAPAVVAVVAAAALLPVSQLHNDVAASRPPDTSRAFVAPLLAELRQQPVSVTSRVELADTATHWPSTYLLPDVALARGWERQIDESRNPLFYGQSPLTATTYREFLDRNAVGMVAVATGVPLDWGCRTEAALIATGLPYLHQVWRDAHWQLYTVATPRPIVAAPATTTASSDTGLTIQAPGPGRYPVQLRWSPYLAVSGGQVKRRSDGNVVVVLANGGEHELHAVWRRW